MKTIMIAALSGAALWACDARPSSEGTFEGNTQVSAEARVAGRLLEPGAVTAGDELVITGHITDSYGIETATYSWQGAGALALELDADGGYELTLPLGPDENALRIEAINRAGDVPGVFVASYFRDVNPPVVLKPSPDLAATIIGEGEMNIDKEALSFSLSGGTPVRMVSGVAYSKYSSLYGPSQANLPVWRFDLEEDYPLDGADLQFRVLKPSEDDAETEEIIVDWTSAHPGEATDFELTIHSGLAHRIGEESGRFVLELRAFDAVGLESEPIRVSWTQSVLNPPIYLATGSEPAMGSPGGPKDPRSYQLGVNFGEIDNVSGLEVGSLLVGNPNPVPVRVRLDSDMQALASYSFRRTFTALLLDVPPPTGLPCGTANTLAEEEGCLGTPAEWSNGLQLAQRFFDLPNETPLFEIRDMGGSVISVGNEFEMPPNTQYVAVATLANPPGNFLPNLTDKASHGPFQGDLTISEMNLFFHCPFGTDLGCFEWNLASDYRELHQVFATWDFTARVESKVNLDTGPETPFLAAHDDEVPGHSRTLATAEISDTNGFSTPTPTSHDDLLP